LSRSEPSTAYVGNVNENNIDTFLIGHFHLAWHIHFSTILIYDMTTKTELNKTPGRVLWENSNENHLYEYSSSVNYSTVCFNKSNR